MKNLFIIALFTSLSFFAKATDLIVEEFGLTPTYSSISAAVTAAVDGDRIFIKNRAGNIPWVETVSVNKSLEFLPYNNDTFFIVQGNWTVTLAASRTVSIIGMYNTSGNIATTGTLASGPRAVINVFSSNLVNGDIAVASDNVDMNIYGNKLSSGDITIRHGYVIGNEITNNSTTLAVASETTNLNDTIFVIGNRITQTSTSSSVYGIYWASTTSFLDIRNNVVYSASNGIYITNSRASAGAVQKVYNNAVINTPTTLSSTYYGIMAGGGTNSITEIMNNILDKTSTSATPAHYGIYGSSNGQVNAYYNFADNTYTSPITGTFTVNSNNTVSSPITLGANGALSGTGVDGGNPANVYYDLDLTRNDVGAYGGSFTQNNFFPLFTGATRTWLTAYPFNIRTGSTLSIKATSFDR